MIPSRPKILLSMPALCSDGIMIHWLTIFYYLQKQGFDFYLLGGTFLSPLPPIEDPYTFNQNCPLVTQFPSRHWSKLSFMFHALIRNCKSIVFTPQIIKKKIDVIYSPTSVLDMVVIPYIVKTISPSIKWVTVFDNVVPLNDPGNKFFRLLAWAFYQVSLCLIRRADIIFCISPQLRQYLIGRGFPAPKLVVTGNAVENKLITAAGSRSKFKYDALYLGRINETKGIYDLLEVVSLAVSQFPQFTLAIVGEGDRDTVNKFKQKINQKGLTSNIKFLGYQTGLKKFKIIKSAKVFLFLSKSKSESFGMALLEAVCCGLPAFAYALEPFTYLYRHQEVNLFPIGDYRSVAQTLINTFKSQDFDNKSGKNLLGRFSWQAIAGIEGKTIKSLLSQ